MPQKGDSNVVFYALKSGLGIWPSVCFKTLEKCDKILWLNLNFSKQNGLWFQANCISDNGSKNRSRKIIVPQCFWIQNRIHGFDVGSVHITNRIGKSYGTLYPVNTLLIGKVDLETMESCAPGLASWKFFCFFLLNKNYTLLFALPCLPICEPEALGRSIAIRAKVEQKGREILLYLEKIKN